MALFDFLRRGRPDLADLSRALRDADPVMRRKAVEGLGRSKEPRASALLLDALGDQDDVVRNWAAERLLPRPSEDVVAPLIGFLDADDPLRRVHAARILRHFHDARAVGVFAKAVSHPSDWKLREEAIQALGEIADAGGVEPLILVVEDDEADDSARVLAADALARIGDPLAIEPLERVLADLAPVDVDDHDVGGPLRRALEHLRIINPAVERTAKPKPTSLVKRLQDKDARVRAEAARALGRRRDEATLPSLVHALSDADASVRAAAAESLGKLRDRRAVEPLAPLLQDPATAESAAQALAALGGEQAASALTAALASGTPGLRGTAIATLMEAFPRRATLLLAERLLRDPDPDADVRYAVAAGLGQWKSARRAATDYSDDDVFALAELAFADADGSVRSVAVFALAEFGERPKARELLHQALVDPAWLVRQEAVYKLGEMYTLGGHDMRGSLPRILELLRSDPDVGVRGNAAQAIGHYFRRPEDEPALRDALNDSDEGVRSRVRSALAALRGEPSPTD